jgi:SAM-dependent methyltransferase
MKSNSSSKTINSFGKEWSRFRQESVEKKEAMMLFTRYFSIFPWHQLPNNAKGFDMGCGSGRWAKLVAPKVTRLTCIDPAADALAVAKENLREFNNIDFLQCTTSEVDLNSETMDFGYSLGVLHHLPDAKEAIKDCARLLKPGAPFLIYLYYRLENRPFWYYLLWKFTELQRFWISKSPDLLKNLITDTIAILVYWPAARTVRALEKIGFNLNNFPLATYSKCSFYTMRTDARDRFGTPLEKRFSKKEILFMLEDSGFSNISFSESEPYWCAVAIKRA